MESVEVGGGGRTLQLAQLTDTHTMLHDTVSSCEHG